MRRADQTLFDDAKARHGVESDFKPRVVKVRKGVNRYDFLRTSSEPVLHLVDASDLIYKNFFAIPKTVPGNAHYGFIRSLVSLMQSLRTDDKVCVAFDTGATWRHEVLGDYKSGRAKYDDLRAQLDMCREEAERLLGKHRCIGKKGMEADDIIAELVASTGQSVKRIAIHANDQDFLQLLDQEERVSLLKRRSGEYHMFRFKEVVHMFNGLTPEDLPLYWSLVGQSADAIKGVPGVGPKRAAELILRCKGDLPIGTELTLDHIFRQSDIIANVCGPQVRKAMTVHKEQCEAGRSIMLLPSPDDRQFAWDQPDVRSLVYPTKEDRARYDESSTVIFPKNQFFRVNRWKKTRAECLKLCTDAGF